MSEEALHAPPNVPMICRETLTRLNAMGPQCASYPTADRFVEAFGSNQYVQALRQRGHRVGALFGRASALSLYIHIPFCESVCNHCACNKVITRHRDRAAAYLADLREEIRLVAQQLGPAQSVSQLHFGGGNPTLLSDTELFDLLETLRHTFLVAPACECTIEIDPSAIDRDRLSCLHQIGFNRLSFGIQDFAPDIPKAVNGIPSHQRVSELVQAAREEGFESLSMDLIYGLPKQTCESFARTLAQVVDLRPDRIALYAYAHLPERFKHQRRIDEAFLPKVEDKIGMLAAAIDAFGLAGYDHIGMEHFALPHDSLAVAKRQGRLHRNLQGYSTHPDGDLIGLGVSAIGMVGAHCVQNAKTLAEYHDALNRHQLPVSRGLALSRDDLVRRAVIMAILCHGRVDFESIELAYLLDFRQYFQAEMRLLEPLVESGLVRMESDGVRVTPLGCFFVRAVAMVFDRHLQADEAVERFSRII